MIEKVLIANRGEIAIRIIRACREMNIATVAIYSVSDKDALHVKLADEAVCIGGSRADESYLNINNILQAAVSTQADAIHPGFGFLSEKANFVKLCEKLNITFIGPNADIIDLMGNKANAKQTMINAGVPVVPGSTGLVETSEESIKTAQEIGLPVLIKASAGGGGKGMRVAYQLDEVETAYNSAKHEAIKAFKDGSMYIEKYIEHPRHIEIQVIADRYGNVCHLFERECSIQRNNQKMIEEAPVVNLKQETKDKLYRASIDACKSINYLNAGTIEFIMDKDEKFYFIEMNTRIQVEHPVTEMITGIDIVKEQINIASGNELSFKQKDLQTFGHAIEIRINAENPKFNFAPSPGKIKSLHFPGGNGVRIDSAIYQNYTIPPYYDSMIAKLIVHGKSRAEAIEKGIHSLAELDIEGVETNIDFQLDILLSEQFQENKYTTSFVEMLLRNDNNV